MIGRNSLAPTAVAELREIRLRPLPMGDGAETSPVHEWRPRASSGDVRVENAVRTHLTLVWQVLRRSGLRACDADDATQDVFWVFAQRSHEVPEPSVRAFLVATALRVASDRRKSKWFRIASEALEQDMLASSGCAPDEQAQLLSQTRLLDQLLASMPTDEREIFILFEVEQMTRKEVAEALGIPEGTAASRLRRARGSFDRLLRRRQPTKEQSSARR